MKKLWVSAISAIILTTLIFTSFPTELFVTAASNDSKKIALGDKKQVEINKLASKFNLGISYITSDITLAKNYKGMSIQWTGNDYINKTGKVTRPESDTEVKLTGMFTMNGLSAKREFQVTVAGKTVGHLATYIAKYEPDLGPEYAQYPSKEYTNTYRTDVLYYGLSQEGKTYSALNNDKAVMFPISLYKLGSPSIFRKGDGTYGLIAAHNNSTDEILVYDSKDLLFYENQRVVKLNKSGIVVKNPTVMYDNATLSYNIYWEGGDGKSYVSNTKDFTNFSNPKKTKYKKAKVNASLPEYAAKAEASIFDLTKSEYDRIKNKFGRIHSVAVNGISDLVVKSNQSVSLPKNVDIIYSDGSKTQMGVDWNVGNLDLNKLKKGEYTISGTVKATTEYNSPLAEFRADPYVVYDEKNKVYYFTGSNLNANSAKGGGAYQNIVIRKSSTINGIKDAKEFVVWKDTTLSDGTKVTGWYWAPEIHKIGGKWRIMALATVTEPGTSKGGWKQCIFTCNGDDLTDAKNWEYTGYIHPTKDGQWVGAFDTTYFEYNGRSYYVTPKNSRIWITSVDPNNLLYPTGRLVQLSASDRAFEYNIGAGKKFNTVLNYRKDMGQAIEEAPGVLIHNNKIFISYAGSTVDMMYCVNILYADLNSDLMNPNSWKKYPYPILSSADLTTTIKQADYSAVDKNSATGLTKDSGGTYQGTFGPGHNIFTIDENGNPVIVYHARDWDDSYPGATGEAKYGLVDPGRHAYAKIVHFGADGFPVCNMSPQDVLADSLKNVSVKLTVTD